ncbi:hypothetical protein, partial [Streptomyces sp. NPDC005827]|uniref:hypothetical protein n=1 Tax=Streptomyces sp. NPDC005827 TaxID=3157070 RepID=UPI0033C7B7C9
AGRHRVRDGRREGGGLIDGFLVERLAESDYSAGLLGGRRSGWGAPVAASRMTKWCESEA